MKTPDYNSPAALSSFLEEKGLGMQKKFGQNFLISPDARKRIVAALDIQPGESVWEVGPGLGSMTSELLQRGAVVTAFEIDRGFSVCLRDFFSEEIQKNQLTIIEGDVLKNWQQAFETKMPDYFFGNLPYNIAATLIAATIEKGCRFKKCAFTVQKEVAQRMAAKPSSEDYSCFSVLCQWAYDVKNVCYLGRANFWPRPNVDSRTVVFTKKDGFPGCSNSALLIKMNRGLFLSRRKTVKNNLTKFLSGYKINSTIDGILEAAAISPLSRAEALSVGELLRLSDAVNNSLI